VDNTVDDKEEVEQDAGAVPAISTNTEEVEGWMNEKERTVSIGLTGYNTQGMKVYPDSYYYTQEEWSRSIGWGTVPPERQRKNNGDETGSTGNGNL